PVIDGAPPRPLGRLDRQGFSELGLDLPRPLGHVQAEKRVRKRARVSPKHTVDRSKAFPERLVGITSVLWNQPRTTTLVAGSEGCILLLVKRVLLTKLVNSTPAWRPWNRKRFWADKLPRLL